ncbi:MAG: hypothetical protein F6J95_030125 [Leptolyngbya sp. SIO1E4]|nr:hypothetical protein [Leptolyngbya sp. SIO1E4]
MKEQVIYRDMRSGEEPIVCELVRQVFDEFVAPDYGKAGAEEFFRFANPDAMETRLFGVPMGLLFVKQDFEHAAGYHFFIDFVRFWVAL